MLKWRRLITRDKIKEWSIDGAFIIAGCSLGAFSSICIMIPNGLSSGGITGICRVLQVVTNVDFSILYYSIAFLILLACGILLGFRQAKKILLLTIIYPAFLLFFEQFNISLLEEKDVILAAVYCGVFSGICGGLIFTRGYSFGGTDTIAKIIMNKWFPQVGLSKILLVIDATIIITSGIFFGRNIALYALITQIIFSRVVDYVMYGFDSKVVQLEIISDKHDEIANYILHEIKRGVSNVKIIGQYTQLPREKLITLCSARESMLIKQFVAKADGNAVVTVVRVEALWGFGEGIKGLVNEKEI